MDGQSMHRPSPHSSIHPIPPSHLTNSSDLTTASVPSSHSFVAGISSHLLHLPVTTESDIGLRLRNHLCWLIDFFEQSNVVFTIYPNTKYQLLALSGSLTWPDLAASPTMRLKNSTALSWFFNPTWISSQAVESLSNPFLGLAYQ